MTDDSMEAIERRAAESVVWAEGEVTQRVSDALWRAAQDRRLLLEARRDLEQRLAALEGALRNLADEAQRVIDEEYREDIDFEPLHRLREAAHRLLAPHDATASDSKDQ